jgi:thioredoxin-dependent peroxiredoxin
MTRARIRLYCRAMKALRRNLLTMSLLAFLGLVPARAIEVGADAPTITAVDQDGNKVTFADVYKKGITLVYFYPKADTPGCTKEACSLRDSFPSLRARGLQVLGVSEDNQDAQKKFQTKYSLPFPLIADNDGSVAKAFGVPTTMGFAKRQSFIVLDGKIAWLDLNASTSKQAADVTAAMDSLQKK